MSRFALALTFAAAAAATLLWPPAAKAQTAGERQLAIRIYAGQTPQETILIPLSALRIAAKFVPGPVMRELELEGLSVEQILEVTEDPELQGLLARIEDHEGGETIVVAIE